MTDAKDAPGCEAHAGSPRPDCGQCRKQPGWLKTVYRQARDAKTAAEATRRAVRSLPGQRSDES